MNWITEGKIEKKTNLHKKSQFSLGHNFINIGPILNFFASMSLSCCTDYFEPKHDILICRNKKVNFFTYAGAEYEL